LRVVHDAAEAKAMTRAPAAGVLLACLALVGCGGAPASSSSVRWDKPPIVVRQPELPDDTIVSGALRNGSDHALHLEAGDVRVVTAEGDPVQSTARFTTGVTHQLYPPREGPREGEPDFLRTRLGEIATVAPGDTTPFVVSWRAAASEPQPVKVELGDEGSLTLP
jgi:hypothetical protein